MVVLISIVSLTELAGIHFPSVALVHLATGTDESILAKQQSHETVHSQPRIRDSDGFTFMAIAGGRGSFRYFSVKLSLQFVELDCLRASLSMKWAVHRGSFPSALRTVQHSVNSRGEPDSSLDIS
jgi:hypothetical protein